MARAKFLIALSIFITAALFIGEVYSFFLSDFENKYPDSGYWVPGTEDTEPVKQMVIKMTEEANFPVFSLQKESQGAFSRTVTIYANDLAKQVLKNGNMQIVAGEKKSFFTGTTTFVFEEFENIPPKCLREVWYPVSREEIMASTPEELAKYSGGFVRVPMPDESWLMIVVTWVAASIILLFLTWYDLVYSKKEQVVRIVLGADSTILMRDKIVKDSLSYTLAAVIAFIFMRLFTYTFFHVGVSVICLIIFLFLNAVVIFLNMGLSSKRIKIKYSSASKRTLKASLAIKFVMGLLCVVVLSLAIGIAGEGKILYDQRDSYAELSDRTRARIVTYPFDYEKMTLSQSDQSYDTMTQLDDNFMRYAYKYLDCSTAMKYSIFFHHKTPSEIRDRFILANPNGIEAHKSIFNEWDYMMKNEGDYLLIPKGSNRDNVLNILKGTWYSPVFDAIYEYDSDVSIIAEEWHQVLDIKYSYEIDNPYILLDTHDYTKLSMYSPTYESQSRPAGEIYGNLFANIHELGYIMQFSSVIDDQEKIKEFGKMLNSEIIDPDLVDYEIINLNSWYQELWGLIGSSMIISIVLTIIIFLLRSQITLIILNLEYEVNAQELTIKKVMGFSIYERYKKMFEQTIIMFAVIMIAALGVYLIFDIGILKYLFAGCLIVFVTDIFLMSFLIRKGDKMQISKVLKGGI